MYYRRRRRTAECLRQADTQEPEARYKERENEERERIKHAEKIRKEGGKRKTKKC
jgi:hypothetical protein